MKIRLSILSVLLLVGAVKAQTPAIIPKPVSLKQGPAGNNFSLQKNTVVFISNDSLKNIAGYFMDYLHQYYGLTIHLTTDARQINTSSIQLLVKKDMYQNPGQYTLSSGKGSVKLKASTAGALFNGIQTLIELLPVDFKAGNPLIIPAVDILDYPRFAYRGMHLDVSRHFFEVSFVKKYIDYLALHKINYFHWHLTDDHGWRIEIKKYPRLTTVGAWRNSSIIGLYPGTGNDNIRYGGYYTQEQIKEVVKYAADRYITIIPEIEMPGHNMGVLAAYPQLSTTPDEPKQVAQTWGIFNKFNNVLAPSEQTFSFLEDVLSEVMQLFPSPYIHIGGDECSPIWWKQSESAQRFIKEKGLKNEGGLQSYFIQRIEKFVNSKGRTIIGWDEILDGGLAPNAIVMSWRGEKGGIAAARQQHKVIMTPSKFMYFNQGQFLKKDSLTANGYLPLANVYNYEPIPKELSKEESKYIWGAQADLWSEYITNPAKVEYMLFPRLDALSEVLWSRKADRNYPDFQNRLKNQLKRYDLMGINYSKRYLDHE